MATTTNATLTTDLRLATAIDFEIHRILKEMFSLESLGIHQVVGSVNGRGAATIRVPYADLDGSGSMTATAAEDSTIASTDITDDSEDVAVTRKSVRYDVGDLAKATGVAGNIDPTRLASMILQHRRTRINIDFATAFAGATADAGTTGTDLTIDDLYDAQFTAREALVPGINGNYVAVLKPKQINELITSARAETGVLVERGDFQGFAGVKPDNFAGMIGNTALVGLDDVTDDATDFEGALLGAGALLFGFADVPLPAAGSGTIATKFAGLLGFMLEQGRTITDAKDVIVGNQWHGVTLRDERAVKIVSQVA